MKRLLPARHGVAAVIAALGWATLLGLALWLRDSSAPTALDRSVASWLFEHTGTAEQHVSLVLTEPVLTVGGCAVITVGALVVRRVDLAVLAAVGPLAGLLLESHVLKPLIGRRFGDNVTGYALPSGHETGLTSLTTLLVIVLLGTTVGRRVKVGLVVLAVTWTVLGALGLVRNNYHYVTDTLAGIAFAVALMTSLALLLDVVTRRLSSPGRRDLARTARAA